MKWFLLLLMAAAAAAIFIFRDELRGVVEKGTSGEGADDPAGELAGSGGTTGTGNTGSGGAGNTPGGTRSPGSNPRVPPTDPPQDPDGADDPIAKRYPLPQFKTLEDAVGNWKAIPNSAFGRKVTVRKPVQIVIPNVGSSTVPAGSQLFALGIDAEDHLSVAKALDSSARGRIHIDDTNFKQVLGAVFDRWKEAKTALVMRQRERARKLAAANPEVSVAKVANTTSAKQDTSKLEKYVAELGPVPKRNPDGTVQEMVNSIRNGDVTEIKLDIIEHWGPIVREVVDGKPYWTATVEYKTVSMFGEINTEAQALIKDGRVIDWIYTGSGEDVP